MKSILATLLITGLLSACAAGDYSSNRGSSRGGHGGHSHFHGNTN